MPKFSVVIPNYNHAAFLKERIESILLQTFSDYELIILDDFSNDDSIKIIEAYQNHPKVSHIVLNNQNSGSPFLQWKKGIELASAEWIWIAESDDIAHPDFLKTAADVITENKSIGLFYSDAFIVNEISVKQPENFSDKKNYKFNTKKWSSSYYTKGVDEINEFLKLDCTINNISSAVFNKQIAQAYTKELSLYTFYGDWFFYLKLAFISNIYYCSSPLNFYRQHNKSHLSTNTLVAPAKYESFKILKLLYYHPDVTDKKKLLNHFSMNHLSFGILNQNPATSIQTLYFYFKADKKLAWKFLFKFITIKLFRKKLNGYLLQKEPVPLQP